MRSVREKARPRVHPPGPFLLSGRAGPASVDAPPEVAGPRVENVVEMKQLFEARRGGTRTIVGARDESDPDKALWDAGAQLPGPGARLAGPTFAEWLGITDRLVAPPASDSGTVRARA